MGRIIRNEWQQVDLDFVPTLYTLGGQTFANAFANLYFAANAGKVPQSQPFFNAALGGPASPYCRGYVNCTAAVAAKNSGLIVGNFPAVYDLWSALASSPGWTLGNTMLSSPLGSGVGQTNGGIFMDGSFGYGNYNAAFVSTTFRDWHGLTARSNFTWAKALGTGDQVQATSEYTVVDPFNIHAMYGPQTFDVRFAYNLAMLYQPPWFKSQQGILGRLLGGWSIAPLFTANSGYPEQVNLDSGNCEAFGEGNCNAESTLENGYTTTPYKGGNSAHYNVPGSNGVGTSGAGVNLFGNPAAVFAQFRPCVLGYDTNCGAAGTLRGFPMWNLDLSVSKDFRIAERFSATFMVQISNVLNHMQPQDPGLDITNPTTFGVVQQQSLTGATGNGISVPPIAPRQIEFGLRIHF